MGRNKLGSDVEQCDRRAVSDWKASENASNSMSPHTTPVTDLGLPIELWIQVLRSASRGTQAKMMLVNRPLSEIAESLLYHSVTLTWNIDVPKFSQSIASCIRRASLVIDIHILQIKPLGDNRVPALLPYLIGTLQNLRTMTLKMTVARMASCDDILHIRLPHLRSFTCNMNINSDEVFFNFLTAHEDLVELDLGFTYPPNLPGVEDRLDKKPFSSLHTIACSSRWLNSRLPVLHNLTHLYRTGYIATEVAHIATLLDPQLISLRLRGRRILTGWDRTEPWSLHEVATKLPKLRYLQIDAPHVCSLLVPLLRSNTLSESDDECVS
ncbi:hypothetical protein BD311DRAFT_721121 [Dichomitus squalens]|uniref:F-box domain-containing protein n=1 Tax=Dichomitus squalens TaxID=114155 RepID=A0A4V6MVY7_9APHY|nr:hypothetical protein BD311DRAFT_721121 [Dichomitus squalens]